MSCMYLGPDFYTKLISWAQAHEVELPGWFRANWSEAAKELANINFAAYRDRYSHIPEGIKDAATLTARYVYRFDPSVKPVPALHILSACDCYDYQALDLRPFGDCEYGDTDAAEIIQAIRMKAIPMLPGYDKAPWGEVA